MTSTSLLLVGCGNMGRALLACWSPPPASLGSFHCDIIDPNSSAPVSGGHITWHNNLESLSADYCPDFILYAIKPQQLESILLSYRERFGTRPLYLSLAAGKSLAFYARHLGPDARVIRAMPNTPALVGESMTVLCAPRDVPISDEDKKLATRLMEAAGKVEWLDESLMDAVTALSGSGPAYIFLFLDALTRGGIAAGLPPKTAKILALQTMRGSALLAEKSDDSFETLRKNVTSPGGTTEAALQVLMKEHALEKLLAEAVQAAKNRAQELAN